MSVQVYVVSDPLAIDFIQNEDLDGFKEYLDSDDLDEYNGNTEHDMWVDFTYHENTDELPDLCDDEAVDDFINNLNDWD